ncbi:hypothetical protein BHE74_00031383 [Ensete ventricosum]|nr:hypothetical protein BHE74_00031383 [Ensete ventricosum]
MDGHSGGRSSRRSVSGRKKAPDNGSADAVGRTSITRSPCVSCKLFDFAEFKVAFGLLGFGSPEEGSWIRRSPSSVQIRMHGQLHTVWLQQVQLIAGIGVMAYLKRSAS